jgi:hypothetical protein
MQLRNLHLNLTVTFLLVAAALPVAALTSGTDIIVPAAARGGTWVTDLFVFNPGPESTDLTISWLVRNRANPHPASADYRLGPGEVLVLEDAIKTVFGHDQAGGAFWVLADQPVVVSSRIYNLQDGVTFGQGFEGIQRRLAIAAGSSTDMIGVTNNESFRTNMVITEASGLSATVVLSLRGPSGAELAAKTYSLGGLEPLLKPVTDLDGVTSLDNGTLHAEVIDGAAIIVASKIDNDPDTGDPTTLAAWSAAGSGEPVADGTYQLAIYDGAGFATGGNLVLEDDQVTAIDVTYTNWDKGVPGDPDCTLTFRWGTNEAGVHSLSEYTTGVSFVQAFSDGEMTWTVSLAVADNQSISGTVEAVGSSFGGMLSGCNGTFPTLMLYGGKSSK